MVASLVVRPSGLLVLRAPILLLLLLRTPFLVLGMVVLLLVLLLRLLLRLPLLRHHRRLLALALCQTDGLDRLVVVGNVCHRIQDILHVVLQLGQLPAQLGGWGSLAMSYPPTFCSLAVLLQKGSGL